MRKALFLSIVGLSLGSFPASPSTPFAAAADEVVRPAAERFAAEGSTADGETPDFRRHVVALAGRLGCNGRACHGSFQGKGGFRLSLFGYDFAEDHKNLLAGDSLDGVPRTNVKDPLKSLVLRKPTLQADHEGGKRMSIGSWQYNLLLKWIKSGAPGLSKKDVELSALEVTPKEISFQKPGETVQLKAIAQWADGTREDVTCLCRFKTNNEQVAKIDEAGTITSAEVGDTHVVVFYDNGVQPIPVIRPVSSQVGDRYPNVPAPTQIDKLVIAKLRKLGIVPSELAGDAEFLRRVSLDMTGTLPSAKEVEAFLADRASDKRAKKIDELLERPSYAAWWTTRLCDVTGNNDQQLNNTTPIPGAASREWYEWIRKRVADNTPYDELAAGIVLGRSRNDGETYTQYAESMSQLYRQETQATGGRAGETRSAAGGGANKTSTNNATVTKASFADRQYLPHYWARQNFRTPEDRAIGFAYSFLGIRIQCAQCHKHPFDQWTKKDFDDFKGFFTSVVAGRGNAVSPESRKEYDEIVKKAGLDMQGNNNQQRNQIQTLLKEGKVIPFPEVYAASVGRARPTEPRPKAKQAQGARVPTAKLLGGETIDLTKQDDARKPLMAWLRDPNNRYFARAFVNRVWAGYFNVGIVQPPDDMSLANPPSNRPLLDYLTTQFIAHKFDMKWLHREIANSRTYQLGWKPNETNQLDEANFSRCVPRRLPAEVAIDAITLATAGDAAAEKFASDMTGRAISIPGTSGGGRRGGGNYALTIFGRSTRESNCDCDRSMEASLLQTVYLQNDQELLRLVDSGGWLNQVTRAAAGGTGAPAPVGADGRVARIREEIETARKAGDRRRVASLQARLAELTRGGAAPNATSPAPAKPTGDVKPGDATAIVKQAYLRTLSRYPSDQELARCREEIEQASDPASGVRNVLWALLNTKEFIVNH